MLSLIKLRTNLNQRIIKLYLEWLLSKRKKNIVDIARQNSLHAIGITIVENSMNIDKVYTKYRIFLKLYTYKQQYEDSAVEFIYLCISK